MYKKGTMAHKNIISPNSLDSIPERVLFEKRGFYNDLKQKTVSDEGYENSKFSFSILKMINLSDINDLYNTQDVIKYFVKLL